MARALGVADLRAGCPCLCAFRVLPSEHGLLRRSTVRLQGPGNWRRGQVQALVREPSDSTDNVGDFAKRMEQAWLISKQPRPVQCVSCEASGEADCPWCKGTGFFTLGDNMLCEVPSRNTSCRVCLGQGTLPCDDCKGTGYRAKWLAQLPKKLQDRL